MTLQPNLPSWLWHNLIIYELHSSFRMGSGWMVSNPKVHGILQNVIQMLTWHPQPLLLKDPNIMEEKSTQLQAK
jgi:hypothetical protein